MSTSSPINSHNSATLTSSRRNAVAISDVHELTCLAMRGLVPMFDADKQLFCHKLLWTKRGPVRGGISPRYTIMTLLGLKRVELTGRDTPFDVQAIYGSLIRDTRWIQGVGDLGLLAWVTASLKPDQLDDVFRRFDCKTALARYRDAKEGFTMELAWFLAGLAHAAETSPRLANTLLDLSVETYHLIKENQGKQGLFGHLNAKKSIRGRIRGYLGSFADQVYPIYALSKFARIFHLGEPLGAALECATAICDAQGQSGQWWWLYNARTGRVCSHYPVYSVHQHGMAPMCLFAVEEVTGQSFQKPIYLGLGWINGANELGVDMRDCGQNLIWRCILPGSRAAKFREIALSVVTSEKRDTRIRSLEILYEQRPYEFGWLLFAFAGNSQVRSLPNSLK
jgi:hypothetical protein